MNPLMVEALGSLLRWGLAIAAGVLVEKGIWTEANAAAVVSAGALALTSLGLSLWQKFQAHQKLVTAIAAAGMTEEHVEARVAAASIVLAPIPSVTTHKDVVPAPKEA